MIPLFKVHMTPNIGAKLEEVLMSGFIGQGKKVEEFEDFLKCILQNKYILTVNSATSALHTLLHMFKEKDCEVLTSPLTCTATNWPILANGMKIKWVDVDDTCNMDLEDLERKLSPTTKIIMLVHWGGYPIDLTKIQQIREKCLELYGFMPIVIQDCAHSMKSTYKGNQLSCYYNGAYSFQAIKHFTTVDGGCLFVNSKENYERAKLLRWYGIDRESNKKDFRCEENIYEWGYKFHMNDVNATIGIHNLPAIDFVVSKHRNNSNYFDTALLNTSGITVIEKEQDRISSQWIHTIHIERRDDFIKYMTEKGIMTSRVHERNDKHTCVSDFKTQLPQLEKVVKTMVCIPNGWWVANEDREYITETIKKGW